MQDYNFNFEIRTLLTHFAAAFNDVKIKRFDGKKFEKEVIKVPFVYGPKTHILADIIGLTDTVRLPIMAVEVTSQGRDNERIRSKFDDIRYKNSDGTYTNLKAIPWNVTVEMTILAKYQEDMDQIVQNFVVQSNPYIIISWQEPKSGREVRTEILWDGNVSYKYPGKDQASKDFPFRITATAKFTIKGYMYKTEIENSVPICKIDTDYVFTDKFYCNYDALLEYTKTNQTDSYSITGRPVLRYVTSPYYTYAGASPSITIQGYGMGTVNSIFVSGSTPEMYSMSEFTINDNSVVAFPVSSFTKSTNSITFNLPPALSSGFVDIIASNSCGYGKLTEDANRCNRLENPYPIDSPEHYSWTVLQFPYLNGLIVSNYFDPYCIDETLPVYHYIESNTFDRDALLTKIKELMTLGEINYMDLAP
jgi:hypothetical protein